MTYQRETKIVKVEREGAVYDLWFETEWGPAKIVLPENIAINIAMKASGKKSKGGSGETSTALALAGKKLVIVIN